MAYKRLVGADVAVISSSSIGCTIQVRAGGSHGGGGGGGGVGMNPGLGGAGGLGGVGAIYIFTS